MLEKQILAAYRTTLLFYVERQKATNDKVTGASDMAMALWLDNKDKSLDARIKFNEEINSVTNEVLPANA